MRKQEHEKKWKSKELLLKMWGENLKLIWIFFPSKNQDVFSLSSSHWQKIWPPFWPQILACNCWSFMVSKLFNLCSVCVTWLSVNHGNVHKTIKWCCCASGSVPTPHPAKPLTVWIMLMPGGVKTVLSDVRKSSVRAHRPLRPAVKGQLRAYTHNHTLNLTHIFTYSQLDSDINSLPHPTLGLLAPLVHPGDPCYRGD